jgi:hypothetical protein
MSDLRTQPDDRLDGAGETLEDEITALQGEEPIADQDGAIDVDDVEAARTPTRTELDEGAAAVLEEASLWTAADAGATVSLDALTASDLRDGETDNPIVAAEEGQAYVPPTDPPTAPSDDPQGIDVASGSGVEAASEPFDDDHRSGNDDRGESDLNGRIREAIRDDAATSELADRIEIAVIGATVVLRGTVDEIDDGDALAAVIERVPGIDEVRDETEVAALG